MVIHDHRTSPQYSWELAGSSDMTVSGEKNKTAIIFGGSRAERMDTDTSLEILNLDRGIEKRFVLMRRMIPVRNSIVHVMLTHNNIDSPPPRHANLHLVNVVWAQGNNVTETYVYI